MAISLLSHTSAVNTADTVTTSGIDTSSAGLIVVGLAMDNSGTVSLSDSKSNTWTALTSSVQGNTKAIMYYCLNPKTGTSHTFTNAGNQNYSTIYVSAFKFVQTVGGFDQENGGAASATTVATGSVTPGENNELVITQCAVSGAALPISIDSSFTLLDDEEFGAANNYGGASAYIIQTTAGAVNPTWTRTNSNPISARIATFKANKSSGFFRFGN